MRQNHRSPDAHGDVAFACFGGQSLFHRVGKIRQRTSVISTIYLTFGEWPSVSGGPKRVVSYVLAAAIERLAGDGVTNVQ